MHSRPVSTFQGTSLAFRAWAVILDTILLTVLQSKCYLRHGNIIYSGILAVITDINVESYSEQKDVFLHFVETSLKLLKRCWI